jgi:hypothetical protein
MRPSGHTAWEFHPARLREAVRQGFVDARVCRGICVLPPARQINVLQAIHQRELTRFGPITIPWQTHFAMIDEVLTVLSVNSQTKKQRLKQPKQAEQLCIQLRTQSQGEVTHHA